MKKIAVIASGWHYAYDFYIKLAQQEIPKNIEVDYFIISHRPIDNINTINEKEKIRNYNGNDPFLLLDRQLYRYVLRKEYLDMMNWKYIEKPNTIGDMEIFNQWCEDYDYKNYDVFLITHDDNLIISNQLFIDIFQNNIDIFQFIGNSRYKTHKFKTKNVKSNFNWIFLDNGYSEYIPKAFTPRGSFSFYTRELIDLLPNNKFPMDNVILTREGKTDSVKHFELAAWNTNAGNFRDFLYDNNLVDRCATLSTTKRISKYCIEGERGFIHNNNSGESQYYTNLKNILI